MRIDALDPAVSAQNGHEIAAMLNDATVKLTLQQLSDLFATYIRDGAPPTLNTLDKLAAALGDNPNYAADQGAVNISLSSALASRLSFSIAQTLSGAEKNQGQTNLGVRPGAEVQAYSPLLANLAAQTGVNGSFLQSTGAASTIFRPIAGTATRSGGVATGSIFEYNSTASGMHIKFADGTMICYRPVVLSVGANTRNTDSGLINWPVPFTSVSDMQPFISMVGNYSNVIASASFAAGVSASQFIARAINLTEPLNNTAGNATMAVFGIGKWSA